MFEWSTRFDNYPNGRPPHIQRFTCAKPSWFIDEDELHRLPGHVHLDTEAQALARERRTHAEWKR